MNLRAAETWRQWLVLLVLGAGALAGFLLEGPERFQPVHRMGFEQFMPDEAGGWLRQADGDG